MNEEILKAKLISSNKEGKTWEELINIYLKGLMEKHLGVNSKEYSLPQ